MILTSPIHPLSTFKTADWALTFHIAVRQETVGRGRIHLRRYLWVHIAIMQQRQKEILGYTPVILGVGMGEQILGQPQSL